MIMSDVMIQLGESGYRIRQGTATSDEVILGEPIEWRAPNGKTYLACIDLPDGSEEASEVESMFEHYVYEVRPVVDADIEEVELEEDEEGEGDGDGDEEEDEDEPETPEA